MKFFISVFLIFFSINIFAQKIYKGYRMNEAVQLSLDKNGTFVFQHIGFSCFENGFYEEIVGTYKIVDKKIIFQIDNQKTYEKTEYFIESTNISAHQKEIKQLKKNLKPKYDGAYIGDKDGDFDYVMDVVNYKGDELLVSEKNYNDLANEFNLNGSKNVTPQLNLNFLYCLRKYSPEKEADFQFDNEKILIEKIFEKDSFINEIPKNQQKKFFDKPKLFKILSDEKSIIKNRDFIESLPISDDNPINLQKHIIIIDDPENILFVGQVIYLKESGEKVFMIPIEKVEGNKVTFSVETESVLDFIDNYVTSNMILSK